MGVLYDYFRGADAATVVKLMDVSDGGSPPGAVDAKGIDPVVALGKLIAHVRDEPWTPDVVTFSLVWPPGAETDPEHEGPWVEEFDDRFRDTLAGLDDARVPELAEWWCGIEEFGGSAESRFLASGLTELVELARDARAAGQRLYCWSSL